MDLKFGTSGLRGPSADLLDGGAASFSSAFVRHLLTTGCIEIGGRMFIGRDLRESSPAIAVQCMKALAQAGMVPVDCGPLPTPALALYAGANRGAAIMVTGSHIPANRNGLKFYRPDGEIDKADEARIIELALEPDAGEHDALPKNSGIDEAVAAWALYRDRCLSILPAGALSGLRVGVYQHSSVARDFVVDLLSTYGAEVLALGRSETFIAIDTEAIGNETGTLLRKWVLEHGLDAVVSTDADGDRPLIIDDAGSQIRGDTIGLITALAVGADCIVTPVTTNSGIDRASGVRTIRTRVGSPYVIQALLEASRKSDGIVTGFEANGGFILVTQVRLGPMTLEALPTRDSILPILTLLGQNGASLSRHVRTLNLPVCMSDRLVGRLGMTHHEIIAALAADRTNIECFMRGLGEVAHVDWTDGPRITLHDGSVVHLRPSGNAPEMRCYAEAATHDAAVRLLRHTLARLRERTIPEGAWT